MADVSALIAAMEEIIKKGKSEKKDPQVVDMSAPQIKTSNPLLRSPRAKSPVIKKEFQFLLVAMTACEDGCYSYDIPSQADIQSLVADYRTAHFNDLYVEFQAYHYMLEYPNTVDVCWCPQNKKMVSSQMGTTYGSQTFVLGGPHFPINNHPVVHADLRLVNPCIKSSVNFNDGPRLYINFRPSSRARKLYVTKDTDGKEVFDSKAERLTMGRAVLKGSVSMSSAAFHPGAEEDS